MNSNQDTSLETPFKRDIGNRDVRAIQQIDVIDDDVYLIVQLQNGVTESVSVLPNTKTVDELNVQTQVVFPPELAARVIEYLHTTKNDGLDIDPNRYMIRDGSTSQFSYVRFAEDVEHDTRYRPGFDNRLWAYQSGVYLPIGEGLASERAAKFLGNRYNPTKVNGVVKYFYHRDGYSGVLPENPSSKWVNCMNGLIDWRADSLREHSTTAMSTVQIPVNFKRDAECPAIDKFLHEVFPADAIDFAWEMFGYMLLPGNPYRKVLLLLGRGANGKTTLLRLLGSFIGARNYTSIPLQTFAENRFVGAQLYGKLANLAGDLDSRKMTRTDMFKQITGNDQIYAEHKNKDGFMYTPFAKHVFAANALPATDDISDGYFDRWLIVPFERRFQGKNADPYLIEKLTSPSELSGLLNKALDGLRRLEGRGYFEIPASVEQATIEYQDTADNVRAFANEEVRVGVNERIERRRDLYDKYLIWCDENGRHPLGTQNFYERFMNAYPSVSVTKNGVRNASLIKPIDVSRRYL